MELHGGRVDVRSPGQGATFSVCLPRQGRRCPRRPPAPTSFLLVEDNRDAAEARAALLVLDGHRVHVALDGQQALDLALHEPPRVMLLDIGLPGIPGLEVARRSARRRRWCTPSSSD